MQFSNPTTPSDIEGRTGENVGYDQPHNGDGGVTIATISHDTDASGNIATLSEDSESSPNATMEMYKGQPHFNNPLANTSTS